MSLQNSRFMDRLNTNFVPSDPELEEIRSFLTNPLNELARLDAQIADLHARRKMLTEMIDAHKALLSPMRRVPHDVLQEIFISCLPTDHNSLMDAREAPMILGHICSGWRRLALSTPMLWSSIHIPSLIKYSQSSIPSDFIPRCGELVQAWLDRSGNCSLSISNHDFTATETTWIEEHLLRVSRRLRHLDLFARLQEIPTLLKLGRDDLPILESIQLGACEDGGLDFWKDVTMFQVPSLRKVKLEVMGDVRTLPLPWSQLTELNLGCIAPWQADESGNLNLRNGLELLRRCPNLVQCYLNIVTSDLPFVAGPTVTLVHLQTLIVRTVDTTIEFLKCLFLPNIRYLHIWDGDVYIGPTPALQPLERRPRSFTVKLSPELFSRLALVELLQRYPEVSQFILHPEKHRHDSIFDDAFLSILTPNPEAPTSLLCPYLKRLQFANGNAQCSDAAVVQFIRARMETGNPVEEIDIGFGRQIETDILPDLQPFISEGLRVNLRYYTTFKWEYNAREGLSLDEV